MKTGRCTITSHPLFNITIKKRQNQSIDLWKLNVGELRV